eukprot:8808838-Alexandrium_andersonii.AAC.1
MWGDRFHSPSSGLSKSRKGLRSALRRPSQAIREEAHAPTSPDPSHRNEQRERRNGLCAEVAKPLASCVEEGPHGNGLRVTGGGQWPRPRGQRRPRRQS